VERLFDLSLQPDLEDARAMTGNIPGGLVDGNPCLSATLWIKSGEAAERCLGGAVVIFSYVLDTINRNLNCDWPFNF